MANNNTILYTLPDMVSGAYSINVNDCSYYSTYGFNNVDEKIKILEKDVKTLKKALCKLSTLLLTHIGNEQAEGILKEIESYVESD